MKRNLDVKRGIDAISRFGNARVLVVGDLIMDHFIWGAVKRISPEAPVPVVNVTRESLLLGGAANVANNIRSIGGGVLICGVVGKDEDGRNMIHELRKRGIPTDGIIAENDRPTTIKTRVIAHSQQVVRFDRENRDGIQAVTMKSVLAYLMNAIKEVDVVVVSDYDKGLITRDLVRGIIRLGRKNRKVVMVDPKVRNFDYYEGSTVITPNNEEASLASGIEIIDNRSLLRAGSKLMDRTKCQALLITRGENGMSLFERGKRVYHIPTIAREVYDVSGAGDTVVAVLALSMASGASLPEAAVLANYAAGIVVSKLGTATVDSTELLNVLQEDLS